MLLSLQNWQRHSCPEGAGGCGGYLAADLNPLHQGLAAPCRTFLLSDEWNRSVAIGRLAAAMIRDGDTVLLDGGTTTIDTAADQCCALSIQAGQAGTSTAHRTSIWH